MDKATLSAMILDTSHRSDLSSVVDNFIRQAEAMISRHVRATEQIVLATIEEADRTAANEPTYNLPANFLAARVVWTPSESGFRIVENKSLAELRRMTLSAPVHWYALRGSVIEFRGNPASTDVIELDYFARLAALVNGTDTNDLLEAHEELYLAASLFFLHRYTQDTELADLHLNSFQMAAEKLNEQAAHTIGGQAVAPSYNFNPRASY